MNRHQRRLRAKAKPVRLPPPESDDYKVLRLLVAQMPMVQQAADGMMSMHQVWPAVCFFRWRRFAVCP